MRLSIFFNFSENPIQWPAPDGFDQLHLHCSDQLDVPHSQQSYALKGHFVFCDAFDWHFFNTKRSAVSSANQCAHIFVGNTWLLGEGFGVCCVHLAVILSQQWLESFLCKDLLLVLQRSFDKDIVVAFMKAGAGAIFIDVIQCISSMWRRCGLQARGKYRHDVNTHMYMLMQMHE